MNSWLTNELRPYFGLQLLQPDWKLLQINSSYWIALDGDIARKRISCTDQTYHESDIHIKTRDEQWILPQTAKGKEKKLNYSSISAIRNQGVAFAANIADERRHQPPHIRVWNSKNGFTLPIHSPTLASTAADMISWLQAYPLHLPSDYEQKLHRFIHTKRKRYSAIPGDIFRVELDLHTDAYVLVIGDLRRMQKDNLFHPQSIWHSVMTMPLFVRTYLYCTQNRSPELSEILAAPLSDRCLIVMDDYFLRGNYKHVGHKRLEETDVVFPIGYGWGTVTTQSTNGVVQEQEDIYRLCWGTGTAVKSESEVRLQTAPEHKNNGVIAGLSEGMFVPQPKHSGNKALENMTYEQDTEQAMAEFGFASDISYDEFNEQTGGLTRKQYLDYVKQTYQT